MPGEYSPGSTNRLMELRSELADLEQKECMLDQQKFWVEQSTRNTREDCSEYPFYKDIAKSVGMYVCWKCFTFPTLTVKIKTENETLDSILSRCNVVSQVEP